MGATSDFSLVSVPISTDLGIFDFHAFANEGVEAFPHLALIHHKLQSRDNVLVRIHSECMTGDLFGSNRCECGEQLTQSLGQISEEGGILIYLRQEGRGIGLVEKLRAYQLQNNGRDTVAANVELGHAPDDRSFSLAIRILQHLEINSIRLLTNNPDKIEAIENSPIHLVERVPLIIPSHAENEAYLETKKKLMGHLL